MPSFHEKHRATNISLYPMMFPYTICWNLQILHPRHHSSWTGTLLPFILGYFFIDGRICINYVTQQCHITVLFLRPLSFFEIIFILFLILYYFSDCCHLFFRTSLILLFLYVIVRDISYKSNALVVWLETFHEAYS